MAEGFGSTIYDVAEKAGTSISTVSRYLNAPDKVNDDTALRIRAAVDELGYIRHGNAGPRAFRRVGRVGVLAPFFTAPSFIQRLQGIAEVLRRESYEMLVYAVDAPEHLDNYLRSSVFAKRLDGLIVMSMRISDEHAQWLRHSGLPVVLIEQSSDRFSCIECDNVAGGRLAAEHFLSKGYEPCGYIGERQILPYSLQPSQLRLSGFRSAMEAAGKSLRDDFVVLGEGTVEDARRIAYDLLSKSDRPRAIFACWDLLAFGVIKAARSLNLRIPEDVAILGFDDIEAADYMELSTISQSLYESGCLAAETLTGRIGRNDRPLQTIRLTVSVVQRKTT
ncbi:MAG: hypothetical protein A2Z99_10555 [Treponema sp. GWB1_62_6]|nr:MAG: hypothetical protein A2Z99_10555 [Treponema sp. GWB1_62_6]OHE64848.1 MAG: hypothetical protein A2Y36_17665 [Treponema sp. GWA1_62_8]OHE66795.1 MAG: hypothetical protein A2001_13425 [Treponema sp. GWC1_61_84]OHE75370.1 MAG: hypothetical protein A2413_12685 [Treponema sp. RIFOXYC1_FULL_61_9]HCM27216.1 LacI family transcriptional regulator [Treponema sp.]